jgi:hypothetical protein
MYGEIKQYRVRWKSITYDFRHDIEEVHAMGTDYFLALSPANAALQAERRVPERAHLETDWVIQIRQVAVRNEDGTYDKVDTVSD